MYYFPCELDAQVPRIFGVCNNFAYVIMLTAAEDILDKDIKIPNAPEATDLCQVEVDHRHCSIHSASVVLLCNIVPGLVIKIIYPLIASRISYGVRHVIVCLLQAVSLVMVALVDSSTLSLVGVLIGSVSSGMGESTYLGLASHYSKYNLHSWSGGTGFAGVIASLAYAGMTDHRLLNFSSKTSILLTTIIPVVFFLTYFIVLQEAETVKKISRNRSRVSQITPSVDSKDSCSNIEDCLPVVSRKEMAMTFAKYMIPLFTVYFAQYMINQGLFELMSVFNCSRGFGTSTRAQYRWCQAMYEIGVFISRSSSRCLELNMIMVYILPLLQVVNLVFLLFNAIYSILPHFGILLAIILYEGLIAGAAYVNSFNHIHRKVNPSIRETALAVVTIADTTGILVAALSALPVHNAICKLPL